MPTFRSFAKLNFHLEVAGRRADGFHELRTLFQTIDLADTLEIERTRSGRIELTVTGADRPADPSNLAWRAADRYLAARGEPGEGVRIALHKAIPAGGGLGGGSANAATVLLALEQLGGRAVDPEWRLATARALGADVPFFLVGGTALATGRGDVVTPLPDPPGGALELWIAVPPWGLPTGGVFAGWRPPAAGERAPWPPFARLLAGGAPPPLAGLVGENDLEAAAFALRPELGDMYTSLARSGARRVRMSGSGSTLFALFDDAAAAGRAAGALPPGTAWKKIRTLGRDAWRAASGFDSREGGV
jgi:4-diphosphocytidyl-2-C-methyl-D-erythritol kinase